MTWKSIRYRLEFLVFRMLVAVIGALSFRQSVRLAEGIARFAFYRLPRKWTRYKVCRENLQIAFGDELSDEQADRIILGMWKHLLRLIVEMIQIPRKLHRENYRECVTFRNRSLAVEALTRNRPVILLSGHFGNWEMSLVSFGLFGFRAGAVARALDNPYLHDWFREFRELTGHYMILKSGASKEIVTEMEAEGMVAMLGDQDAGSRGLFIDFFGKPASTFKSIGVLAMQYDALICVGYARRLEDDFINNRWARYEIGVEEIIDPRDEDLAGDVKAITSRYCNALEKVIRRSPEQYFWLHRRWKSEPRKRKKKQAGVKAA